jgi:K+-transporting ATPase ATPase C chain
MLRYFSKSLLLLTYSVVISCVIYPSALWVLGQTFFPFQANGSLILNFKGKPVGSKLIAQPFTKDEYFQPRPSAASYNASASTSSSIAPSNYALRDRVARVLGPIVKYQTGQLVGPDIERWFQQDNFQGNSHIVDQWAALHNSLALAWVNADPTHGTYVDSWAKTHSAVIAQFIKENPSIPQPKAADLAVTFFKNFSKENPGKFPSLVNHREENGKIEATIEPVNIGSDIQSIFFDMWRQDHSNVVLQDVPGDLVTTSASGLDPHITLQNAEYQLDRVASKLATNLKRSPEEVRAEVEQILQKNAQAPLRGFAGEKFVNVLEINLILNKLYGPILN